MGKIIGPQLLVRTCVFTPEKKREVILVHAREVMLDSAMAANLPQRFFLYRARGKDGAADMWHVIEGTSGLSLAKAATALCALNAAEDRLQDAHNAAKFPRLLAQQIESGGGKPLINPYSIRKPKKKNNAEKGT